MVRSRRTMTSAAPKRTIRSRGMRAVSLIVAQRCAVACDDGNRKRLAAFVDDDEVKEGVGCRVTRETQAGRQRNRAAAHRQSIEAGICAVATAALTVGAL